MNDNDFQIIGLYEHNVDSYKKIKDKFVSGEKIVGIVHATGTGKSYNALQLAFDNKDKKIVYVVPSNGIIEHIKKIIEDNPNLDIKRDFPNLEFRTYQSFISLSEEEISSIDCDLLILDEFHHIGAPVWGARVNTMIETHPSIKVFGMTAYTVRDRGTSYERDMANPDAEELFSEKIESRYDLCDAMIDGVLPKPIYKSAYTNLIGLESKLEERVQKLNATSREYQEYMAILSDVKRRIHEAPSIPNILKKSIKLNGKYIYFCPPCSEEGTNDIETIKKQATEWFREFVPEEDIIIYTSTSDMGEDGKLNRDAFYDDVTLDGGKADNKLRVMFAINQYNEGIHAPNIDGVIMGRETTSDIVYFEQLGRALSVRGNTKEMFDELENYSIEQLIEMCKSRDIPVKENTAKEELIEKLIAPVVIDLTNNYEFIKELENNLRDRIKNIQNDGLGNHRNIKLRNASFDIEIENQDLFEMLKYVSDRLTMTWEEMYEYAKKYYEHHGNLEVPQKFKTNNGYTYDESGFINLGRWIINQRRKVLLDNDKRQKLFQIGMRFENKINRFSWEEMFEYAKKYYEHHGNLEVPKKFRTNDGYTYDENGLIYLDSWIYRQRVNEMLDDNKRQKLIYIGMRFQRKFKFWEEMYEYAKKYYEHHGNLEVPYNFRTNDGYTYDENGSINLGAWIRDQRYNNVLDDGKKNLLLQIGMIFENFSCFKWNKNYEYAKKYYEHHGNLEVPYNFRTNDGYTYDESGAINLGAWIRIQRYNNVLDDSKKNLLKQIGMRFENKINILTWEKMYEYAKKYYEHHGDLEVPYNFRTNDGYTYDESGSINLGRWINTQRQKLPRNSERWNLLSQIDMRFENKINILTWEEMYEYAKKYYEHHGDLEVPQKFRTNDGYTYDENGSIHLGSWIKNQRQHKKLDNNRKQKLLQISMRFENKRKKLTWEEMYEYAKKYYEHYGNLAVQYQFKTNDGYTYDENGSIHLGIWITTQRRNKSLSEEKKLKLEQFGMIWSIRNNKEYIEKTCIKYNIDKNKNKTILSHISIQELESKIEFLKTHNIPVFDENGLLIDIFSMSSPDMKEKYGISLEEIMNEYFIKNEIEKGV